MTPTPGAAGQNVAVSAPLRVPALPTPVVTSAQQAWPTFAIDRQTRATVASGHMAMLTVPALVGSAPAGASTPSTSQPSTLPPTRIASASASAGGFGVAADPSRPMRTAGPMLGPGAGGASASGQAPLPPPIPPVFPTFPAYPQAAAFVPPATQVRAGQAPQVRTARASVNADALAATALRMGWIALICAAVGCVVTIGSSTPITPAAAAIGAAALWLLTCLPAIARGRRALGGGASGITPAGKTRAGWGQALGWIATLLWVVAVVLAVVLAARGG